MTIPAGTRLGAYEVLAPLGAGGMGEIYRGRDTRLDRDVAIKVLPAEVEQDADRLRRFEQEAKATSALNHPNILTIYDIGHHADAPYIVAELLEGEELRAQLNDGPLPVKRAVDYAQQIAAGLAAAHDKGIVHRDLKPENVFVTKDGRVKILDFGLAKLNPQTLTGGAGSQATALKPLTTSGMVLGTVGYMSPEQVRGQEADHRSDIFSLGLILHEMLSGHRTFTGDSHVEVMNAVLKDEPAELSDTNVQVSPALDKILRRCVEKKPERRFHSVHDLGFALEALSTPSSLGVRRNDSPTTPTVVTPMWRRALPWVVTVVATIGAGVGAWKLKPEPARTVTRFSLTLPEDQTFSNTGRQLVAVSPDGTKLVYVANSRLYLRELSGLESHPIPGSDFGGAAAVGPAFSPDGQSVVFFSGASSSSAGAIAPSGSLKRLTIAGGAAVEICPATNPLGLSWDDSGIVFGQQGKGILRVSADAGSEPHVIAAAGTDEVLSNARMLPGARAVLFSAKKISDDWDQAAIVVQPLDGGPRKTVIQGGSDGRYLPTGHLAYAVSGVLLAVPFDLRRMAVTGGAVPLVEGIRRSSLTGAAGAGGTHIAYSSTGTVAFLPGPVEAGVSAQSNADLAIFDRKGVARLLGLPPGTYFAPRVSPDGKSVAFETDDGRENVVWVYQLTGGTAMRRLTFGGRNHSPIWSPDGQWVVFDSDREGDRAIFRQRADGSGAAERLTKPEAGVGHVPQSFSPDGAFLLYSVFSPVVQRGPLWMLSMKDRTATVFVKEHSNSVVEGEFSPDGRWVAYQAREAATGSIQTYLQPFPSTGAKYLVGNGGHPYWSPRGDQLILNVGAGLSAIVPVKTTPAVTFGRPIDFPRTGRMERNPLSNRRNADSLPDGEHIIGVTSAATAISATATTREIVVVLNWFDEVRRKVR